MYIISEKARFLGDIIAAVAAVDEATADEALKLIKFDYEVLPAALHPRRCYETGGGAGARLRAQPMFRKNATFRKSGRS